MDRLPTKVAEDIYDVLVKYAEVDSDYYHRELFVYHFGLKRGMKSFSLHCMDGKNRWFVRENEEYKLVGKGENKVNSIIRGMLK
jgi:hypothetical protein